jgi:hypothetical protein
MPADAVLMADAGGVVATDRQRQECPNETATLSSSGPTPHRLRRDAPDRSLCGRGDRIPRVDAPACDSLVRRRCGHGSRSRRLARNGQLRHAPLVALHRRSADRRKRCAGHAIPQRTKRRRVLVGRDLLVFHRVLFAAALGPYFFGAILQTTAWLLGGRARATRPSPEHTTPTRSL